MDKEYKQFDPVGFVKDVSDGFSIMVCAQRRQGKTVLITDWVAKMQKHRKWKEVYLFSETALSQTDAYLFVPTQNKFETLDLKKINEIFSTQKKHRKYYDLQKEDVHRVLIIADDVINDPAARDKGTFTKLFTQGRHYRIDVIAISQTLKGFSPTARTNSDLMVCWRCLKYDDRDCIINDFLMIEDGKKSEVKKNACELLNVISREKYRAIVIEIHKSGYAEGTPEYVRYYKANDKLQPKMIGKDTVGQAHINEKVKSTNDKGKDIELNLRFKIKKSNIRF